MDKSKIYRFFQRQTTLQEEKEIRSWVEMSPDNYHDFLQDRKMYDAMNLLADENSISSSLYDNRFNIKYWIKSIGKVAAIVAVTLTLMFTYQYFREKDVLSAMQKITVPTGQRINIELPDGTIVWLNSRSSICYSPVSLARGERKIQLDGEAYFEVAHNESRPFVVLTPKGNVEVLGTKFYVEAYSNNPLFIISLIEGSVKVNSENENVTLKPDEMASFQDGKLTVSKIEDYNVYRWREGLISFKDETFQNIMAEFEKCYGVEIKIENEDVMEYRCTGKFRQSDGVPYALRVLQRDVDFKFERNEEDSIIYIR